jgi:Cys-tRNA(Pro)/Cys-tRNA(Cys) deacylase
VAATRAIAACDRAKVAYRVHEYAHDPRAASFGLEAAEAMGVDSARVFKTIVTLVDDQLTVGLVPVECMLDLKALARAAGGKRAALAPVARAEKATGYVVGAISPLGQTRRLPTFVDESLLGDRTVFVSAGRRGLEIELLPEALVALTDATVAAIATTARVA